MFTDNDDLIYAADNMLQINHNEAKGEDEHEYRYENTDVPQVYILAENEDDVDMEENDDE